MATGTNWNTNAQAVWETNAPACLPPTNDWLTMHGCSVSIAAAMKPPPAWAWAAAIGQMIVMSIKTSFYAFTKKLMDPDQSKM